MPASAVQSFTDPGAYADAIRCARADLTVTGRGPFKATLTRVDLPDLLVHGYADNLPRILNTASSVTRVVIAFPRQPDMGLQWNCLEMQQASIMRIGAHADSFQRSSGPSSFGTMSLSNDKMASVAETILGRDLGRPDDDLNVTPLAAAMAKLVKLHADAGNLAETAPEIIVHPESARGLEAALIQSMVKCLGGADIDTDVAAQRRSAAIMRRFHAFMEARQGEAIYMTDVCAAIGVPQRTLHKYCHEGLGMGPKRYLLLRRMHMAREKLRKANRQAGAVTDIACSLGFWNFGRFAVEYRVLFGETPSATLRAPR